MADAEAVACELLDQLGPMVSSKLHCLLAYCQAWHLVWEGRRLFSEPIEAWSFGPVVPCVHRLHQGQFKLEAWPERAPDSLRTNEISTIESIAESYGSHSGRWVRLLFTQEDPWRQARQGLAIHDRTGPELTPRILKQYYQSLADDPALPVIAQQE